MVTVKTTHNPRRKHSRYAIVISKKVLKSAVGRNRIRRRLYEIVRQQLPLLRSNSDVVILVFSAELLTMEHQQLQQLLTQLFSRAKLYK